MKIENVKACVFDAYGTIFDVNSAAEKCKKKLGSKWEGFANAWRTTQLEYTWLISLMKKHKNFWEITEDSLDHTMDTFKIKKSANRPVTKKDGIMHILLGLSCTIGSIQIVAQNYGISGYLGIWVSGHLGIWLSGHLTIWESRYLGI